MRLFKPDVEKMLEKKDVPGLIKALSSKDKEVRCRAAYVLGRIGDQVAIEPLIVALRDSDGSVRAGAAQSLGEIGDPRAVKPLIAASRDPMNSTREIAGSVGYALGAIGAPAKVDPFVKTRKWACVG
jgi:HEAT repeat protein